MKIAAVVMAAGESMRLGQPKQLVQLNGEPLLQRTLRIAAEAACQPVIAVLGANADVVRAGCHLSGAETIVNPEWREGMASSIRMGIRAAADAGCDAVLLMACDQPAVSAVHLRALLAAGESVVASGYAGRRGVPAYFAAEHFGALLALSGDVGARDLLRDAPVVPLPNGEFDVDSPEDLQRMRERFGQ